MPRKYMPRISHPENCTGNASENNFWNKKKIRRRKICTHIIIRRLTCGRGRRLVYSGVVVPQEYGFRTRLLQIVQAGGVQADTH